MEENNTTRIDIKRFFTMVVIAILIAALMTLLSAVPPLSTIYDWLADHQLRFIWYGLTAGIIGGLLSFYYTRGRNKA